MDSNKVSGVCEWMCGKYGVQVMVGKIIKEPNKAHGTDGGRGQYVVTGSIGPVVISVSPSGWPLIAD